MTLSGAPCLKSLRRLLPGQPSWQPHIVLGQHFFEEITRSAVPIDLRAIRKLRRSPFAIDIYAWLTYRMSYLKKPTLVPWTSLEVQFGSDYARLRDFRNHAVTQLENVIRVYPTVRLSQTDPGLRLYPSPPHVARRVLAREWQEIDWVTGACVHRPACSWDERGPRDRVASQLHRSIC